MYFEGVDPVKMIIKDFDMFWKFYPVTMTRMLYTHITGSKLRTSVYGGYKVISQETANELIKQRIYEGKPFMFGRHGTNETQLALHALMYEKGINKSVITADFMKGQCNNCGFFPLEDESLIEFNHLFIEATNNTDVYGSLWLIGESYYIKHYLPKEAIVTHTNTMDFWRYKEPFTTALKGKRVLIVHPLAYQMAKQYEKREYIFKNPDWLPQFTVIPIQAVQTIAGERDKRFDSWFDALAYMEKEVEKQEFDIALLACGAYGMPLASKIKRMGKQVIYMGGVLQLLFGIRGARWDGIAEARALYNEYWEDPDSSLKPRNANSVEGGCYW